MALQQRMYYFAVPHTDTHTQIVSYACWQRRYTLQIKIASNEFEFTIGVSDFTISEFCFAFTTIFRHQFVEECNWENDVAKAHVQWFARWFEVFGVWNTSGLMTIKGRIKLWKSWIYWGESDKFKEFHEQFWIIFGNSIFVLLSMT